MAALSELAAYDSKENADLEEEGKGATHDHFKEIEEVESLIDSLKNVWNDLRKSEMACERFTYIVDDYQEQSHLIDPYLEEIVMRLLTIARDLDSPKGLSQEAFKYLHLVTKMRGFKVVVRLFPHEVTDMEPVLTMIDAQDSSDVESWQTRYILLLWLSILCMIPFDMRRLDSHVPDGDGTNKQPVMERIIKTAQLYLGVNDKCRDAAAYLLSRFMTRPDVRKEFMPQLIDWNLKAICTSQVDTMKGLSSIIGSLTTLAFLFKYGKREDLLPFAPTVLSAVTTCHFMECNNPLLRKTTTKIIQRIGLIFLKYRVASWRYQRGSRSLAENLSVDAVSSEATVMCSLPNTGQEEEEDFDLPEETEEVIGLLLGCLKDKDTVVRWSAAKGVGRVTGRLPKELADEVVGSVLELFSYQETDTAWHGGCLTLAELGRRGLLLPDRLSDVVPIVLKALLYDERKGSYSVGSHVRDAACYVCWAFARAFDPQEIAPYVNKISIALVIVSIFDREVNVRRAAAAAFQENVGRQGTFPHGIDILTTVDYYAVGTRSHCYLELSMFIAQFEEYTLSLIDHLVSVKISHWDISVRQMTADALHKLTVKAPTYMAENALPSLLLMTSDIDLFQRHGSIIATAEVTHALFLHYQAQNKRLDSVLDSGIIAGLQEISRKLYISKLFKGHGGDLMRKSVCLLIKKLSLSKLQFHTQTIIDVWQDFLDECLSHIDPSVQFALLQAERQLLFQPFQPFVRNIMPRVTVLLNLTNRWTLHSPLYLELSSLPSMAADKLLGLVYRIDMIMSRYLPQLSASVESARMGYSLALGALPSFMLQGRCHDVLSSLIALVCDVTKADEKMAEARRDAVKAISSISQTVGVQPAGDPTCCVCRSNIQNIYDALQVALNDYTMDSRGDVGSWVREASMLALGTMTELVVKTNSDLLDFDIVSNMMCGLIQQACEKIDRTRAVAGQVFSTLLYLKPEVPAIPEREKLLEIFPENEIKNFNWALPSETFPRFAKLLSLSAYTRCVLLGMTVSVGGLTESLEVKTNTRAIETFTETLLNIFGQYQKNDRVSMPLLKMLDLLLGRQCFDGLSDEFMEKFSCRLLELVKQEIAHSSDPNKIMAAADVFCGMLQFRGTVYSKSLVQLCMFLCHKYPRVRKTTANKLYEAVLTYEIASSEVLDDVLTILSETNWDDEAELLRPIRNNLCDLFHVCRPAMIKKKPSEETASSTSMNT